MCKGRLTKANIVPPVRAPSPRGAMCNPHLRKPEIARRFGRPGPREILYLLPFAWLLFESTKRLPKKGSWLTYTIANMMLKFQHGTIYGEILSVLMSFAYLLAHLRRKAHAESSAW
jgi:hypothetical protein